MSTNESETPNSKGETTVNKDEITVKVRNRSNNALPEYQTAGAAGMDLRAFISEPIVLRPLHMARIETGLAFEIPEGYEGQIRGRSGLAAKYGVALLNGIGTIDSDYRGEVGVILINFSNQNFNIQPGERVAQIVFAPVAKAALHEIEEIETETERGDDGFGSTGLN